jgi:transposase
MKRLVDTGNLEEEQYQELASLLQRENIFVHETRTHLFDFGAFWVRDEDFARAQEILRAESADYAARARESWERQWRLEYRSSALRWFLHRLFHNPAGVAARVVLLALALGAFVIYPLWVIVESK